MLSNLSREQQFENSVDRIALIDLGRIEFQKARILQEQRIKQLQSEMASEALFFCEHPLTLTLGRRAKGEREVYEKVAASLGAEFQLSTRGGLVTVHNPGQIVFYPVISLRKRAWGVKEFIELVFEVFKQALLEALPLLRGELQLSTSLSEPGLWVQRGVGVEQGRENPRKIAAVGLEIRHGVTNHGFALNYECDLEPFFHFNPCGFQSDRISSVKKELSLLGFAADKLLPSKEFKQILTQKIIKLLT